MLLQETEDSSPIRFEEKSHIYYEKETGKRLVSASQVIELYHEEFDPTGAITERYAAKHSKTVEEVKAEWKKIADDACAYGTEVHANLEEFIKTRKIGETKYKTLFKNLKALHLGKNLKSESRIYSIEHGIAGTVDLIEFKKKNVVNLYDFKTNKKLHFYSLYKKKMFEPVSHMDDCNMAHYTLQLNLYKFMLETHGYWVNDMNILYINRSQEIKKHPIKHITKDIEALVHDFVTKHLDRIRTTG